MDETETTTEDRPALPTVAILAATMPELAPTIRRLNLKPTGPAKTHFVRENDAARVVAAVTGLGPTNAAAALIRLLDGEHVAVIVNVGFAGGLELGLAAGELLDLWWLMSTDGSLLQITDRTPTPVTYVPERTPQRTLLTVDHVVTTINEKRKLYDHYGAASVDMESFQLAKLAVQMNIPFRVIRAISDPANMAIPPQVKHWVAPNGRPDVRAVLRDVLKRPSLLPVLLQLRKQGNLAAEAVARHAADVVDQEIGRLRRGAKG